MYTKNIKLQRSESYYVLNCDESGFQTDPSKLKGISVKGEPLSRISGGSARECILVLACIRNDCF